MLRWDPVLLRSQFFLNAETEKSFPWKEFLFNSSSIFSSDFHCALYVLQVVFHILFFSEEILGDEYLTELTHLGEAYGL